MLLNINLHILLNIYILRGNMLSIVTKYSGDGNSDNKKNNVCVFKQTYKSKNGLSEVIKGSLGTFAFKFV